MLTRGTRSAGKPRAWVGQAWALPTQGLRGLQLPLVASPTSSAFHRRQA
jgi:hypothetical protein